MSSAEERRARVAETRECVRKIVDDVEDLENKLAFCLVGEMEQELAMRKERDAAIARAEKAEAALRKIDAIRNNIIGAQNVNWSRDIYPLVAALGEAGFEGEGYDVARPRILKEFERAQRADRAESVLRALVEALPKCHRCENPATTSAHGLGLDIKCGDHPYSTELKYAAPLRAALALLAGKGEER